MNRSLHYSVAMKKGKQCEELFRSGRTKQNISKLYNTFMHGVLKTVCNSIAELSEDCSGIESSTEEDDRDDH